MVSSNSEFYKPSLLCLSPINFSLVFTFSFSSLSKSPSGISFHILLNWFYVSIFFYSFGFKLHKKLTLLCYPNHMVHLPIQWFQESPSWSFLWIYYQTLETKRISIDLPSHGINLFQFHFSAAIMDWELCLHTHTNNRKHNDLLLWNRKISVSTLFQT